MGTMRLKNNTGKTTKVGDMVRIDPKNPKAIIFADINTASVIGTVATSAPNGLMCTVNLINHSSDSNNEATNGADGKSAYELSVAGGYNGTLQQWLTSLKGADGKDGEDGVTPVKGVDYNDGAKGDKGDAGNAFAYSDFTPSQLLALKGEKGDKGDTGNPGLNATVTKESVENVLTGTITSHSHASTGGLTQAQILNLL